MSCLLFRRARVLRLMGLLKLRLTCNGRASVDGLAQAPEHLSFSRLSLAGHARAPIDLFHLLNTMHINTSFLSQTSNALGIFILFRHMDVSGERLSVALRKWRPSPTGS
nr:hypothetical protein SEVIR_9G402200v2 [Setaria viridis]